MSINKVIDGIKGYVSSADGSTWKKNGLLKFCNYVDTDNGDIQTSTETALYRGLIFTITESKKHKGKFRYRFRGSLHKYHNKGFHNANDFTYSDLVSVLQDLNDKFNINPYTTTIHNLEPSLRLLIPLPVSKFLGNVLSHSNKIFSNMNIKGVRVGKSLERRQYTIKAYDKGHQHPEIAPVDNLISFEIAVKKMEVLKKCGIVHLSDLLDLNKLEKLKGFLLKYWNDIIYFDDKALPYRKMTNAEQKKVLYYANARNWAKFDTDNRYKAKKRLERYFLKYNAINIHADIAQLIAQKWDELAAVNGICLNQDDKKPANKRRCSDHDKNPTPASQTGGCESENGICLTSDVPKKKPAQKRECVVCSTSIESKRVGAIYCSKKCNNKSNYKKRKQERQQKASKEIKPKERQRDKVLMMPIPTLFNQNYDDG